MSLARGSAGGKRSQFSSSKEVMGKNFEQFMAAVRDSCEGQAKRKGYSENDIEGPNQLSEVSELLHLEPQHGIGEIVYKCAEYLKDPRDVSLVKVAGWAYILWRRSK